MKTRCSSSTPKSVNSWNGSRSSSGSQCSAISSSTWYRGRTNAGKAPHLPPAGNPDLVVPIGIAAVIIGGVATVWDVPAPRAPPAPNPCGARKARGQARPEPHRTRTEMTTKVKRSPLPSSKLANSTLFPDTACCSTPNRRRCHVGSKQIVRSTRRSPGVVATSQLTAADLLAMDPTTGRSSTRGRRSSARCSQVVRRMARLEVVLRFDSAPRGRDDWWRLHDRNRLHRQLES